MKGNTHSDCYIAIMGDIVGSERFADVEQLHSTFNRAINESNGENAAHLASPLTITLGDEFQGLVHSYATAFTMARKLRFRLLDEAIECRFAIGLVSLNSPVNPDRAWNMMGEGLASTRGKLNDKRGPSFYRFALGNQPLLERSLEAHGAALTTIERRWTDRQRRDIAAFLAGASAADLARQRNVTVHSIYKVRSSGDFDTYLVILQTILEMLRQLDVQNGLSQC